MGLLDYLTGRKENHPLYISPLLEAQLGVIPKEQVPQIPFYEDVLRVYGKIPPSPYARDTLIGFKKPYEKLERELEKYVGSRSHLVVKHHITSDNIILPGFADLFLMSQR